MFALRLLANRVGWMGVAAAVMAGAGTYRVLKGQREKNQLIPPEPHWRDDPAAAEDLLDDALENSMAASDPPSMTQPNIIK